jgi:azurin
MHSDRSCWPIRDWPTDQETVLKCLVAVFFWFLLYAPGASARTCQVEISGDDHMQFDKSVIRLAADCSAVSLTLRHTGKMAAQVMGHNWVLSKTADYQAVAMAGIRATMQTSFLAKDDARVIAHSRVIGGGETVTITFPTSRLTKGGTYTFFCSFPGHWALMKGILSVA